MIQRVIFIDMLGPGRVLFQIPVVREKGECDLLHEY